MDRSARLVLVGGIWLSALGRAGGRAILFVFRISTAETRGICLMSVSMHRPLPHSLPPLHYTLATSLSPLASRPRGAETMTFWRPVFISRIPVTRERVWPILRILAPKPREREIFSSGPKKLQKSPPPPRVPETDFSSLAGLDGGLSLLDRTKNSTTKKKTRGTEKSERVCFERDF